MYKILFNMDKIFMRVTSNNWIPYNVSKYQCNWWNDLPESTHKNVIRCVPILPAHYIIYWMSSSMKMSGSLYGSKVY